MISERMFWRDVECIRINDRLKGARDRDTILSGSVNTMNLLWPFSALIKTRFGEDSLAATNNLTAKPSYKNPAKLEEGGATPF